MKPGSIFFDTDFHFHDGETGEKLFVVLGSDQGIVVVAKTTSQQHGRSLGYGCQPDDRFPNFYLPLHSCYLKRHTWVCLDEFYELKDTAMLQKRFNGTIKPVCDLEHAITRELQECAADSLDISQQQESLVRACMV